ncbi:uncharacterized protein LOC129596134 [Paramacrobiotus metropolitanus]|uniref:uncharacterized protein LOC129596134 n=1 Tax=Paramacrobiotus metropolitanus TaxID=2943436 RepID=UPI002445B356|nr:uncharacterized protein LOC129596134 [Paramacrobiotus metropolitanus]
MKAGKNKFGKEVLEKLELVKSKKNMTLEVDPFTINARDVSEFVLNEVRLTEEDVKMILIEGKQAVSDSTMISELISRGALKQIGQTYFVEYLILPFPELVNSEADLHIILNSLVGELYAEESDVIPAGKPSVNCTMILSSTSPIEQTIQPEIATIGLSVVNNLDTSKGISAAGSDSDRIRLGIEVDLKVEANDDFRSTIWIVRILLPFPSYQHFQLPERKNQRTSG